MERNFSEVLENLLIAVESYTESKRRVNFFNKEWNVNVIVNDECNPDEANKQIEMFIKNSKKFSKMIEKEFCKTAEDQYNEWWYPEKEITITSYNDFDKMPERKLTLNSIEAVNMYDSNTKQKSSQVGLIVSGEYGVDPEHGWSFGYCNGKWNKVLFGYSGWLTKF